jgi:hypothetical protein
MSIEKEFVPYEEALTLKELGFDEPCFATIDQTEFVHIKGTEYPIRGAMDYRTIDLPTFSQAFRWFREKHGLNSFVYHYGKDGILDTIYFAYNINDNLYASDFRTYEEAELACLRKLIEIVKEKKTMSNNKQQTVVQQIVQALDIECKSRGMNVNWDMYLQTEKEEIEKAKAMHKEEHFNTWWHGISENEPITFEQYYNETFNK